MKYRREIDGLRAIAVLPVILFHAGFGQLSGGYVGVDIFFVISGYLITSILIFELDQDRFSIAGFYERRARRILPALFFVMLACLPFAYMWMLPAQLEDFSQSIISVIFFSSNILFWRESGYFAAQAELKPLLHTWSLAVEEQYYLIFPLFLLITWRFGVKCIFWAIVALAAISLLLSEWGWRTVPGANFYLAPTRAWELLAGSLCAFLTFKRTPAPSNLLSAIGFILILISIFFYDENTPFPSFYTLVPVVGAALVILFAAEGTWVAQILSLRALVGIGLISYSAYLWHQPLFAFARIRSFAEPSHILMGFLAVASLLLAWGTWRWVEQPFRNRESPLLATQPRVFVASGFASIIFIAVGAVGYIGKGLEWRLDDFQREIIARSDPVHFRCDELKDCMIGDVFGEFSGIAFVGDSHMGRYAYLLNEMMGEQGLRARLLTKGWCAPLLHWQPESIDKCGGGTAEDFRANFLGVLEDTRIHTVVLAAQWANYTTGYRHGTIPTSYDYTGDSEKNTDVSGNDIEFSLALRATAEELNRAGKKIIIVGPVPEYDFDVPAAALYISRHGETDFEEFTILKEDYELRNAGVLSAISDNLDGFDYIDVWPLICAQKSCLPFSEEGLPLYNDGNHLVRQGMLGIVTELAIYLAISAE